MSTIARDRALKLLGQGVGNEQVANALGCEPSYISQLLADPAFRNAVEELRVQNLAAATERDRTWDSAEDKVLALVHESLDNNMIHKPRDILHFAAVINNAKRRGIGTKHDPFQTTQVVELNIPRPKKPQIDVTPKGEVIGVGGKSLVTMPSGQLLKMLAAEKGEENEGDFTKLSKSLVATGG